VAGIGRRGADESLQGVGQVHASRPAGHVPFVKPFPLLELRGQLRSIQVLLGHESLETTMIYTHVARQGVCSILSPLDLLDPDADEVRSAVTATQTLADAAFALQ
jgi:hypothetical protein